jgi:hypothetical protein
MSFSEVPRRRLIFFMASIFLIGCSPSYEGPLAEKPVKSVTELNGQVRIISLFDQLIESGVPEIPLAQAMSYFDEHKALIQNQNWLSIIDFTLHSGTPRLYVMNLTNGQVDTLFVAHGRGSDPTHTGYAHRFSNTPNSLMTSLGFYLVAEAYDGKWGRAARMDGLQESNSNARERAIVMHGANYVDGSRDKMGRTWGCPAVELKWIDTLVRRLTGRSLLYAYVEGLSPESAPSDGELSF